MKKLTIHSDNKTSSVSQGFSELSSFIKKQDKIQFVGVNILQSDKPKQIIKRNKNIKIYNIHLPYSKITNPLNEGVNSLKDLRNEYEIVIEAFRRVEVREKPD